MRPDATSVLVLGHAEGKTTQLVQWLIGGEVVDGWPGWSRVLVVANGDRVRSIHNGVTFHQQNLELREAGCEGGLGKVVITIAEWTRMIRQTRDVQWALDDAEELIRMQFGALPTAMTMTGRAIRSLGSA